MRRAIDQVVRELKADKRKLGAVCLLVAVGLLLWGRLMLKNIPQTATAKPAFTASAVDQGLSAVEVLAIEDGLSPRPVVYMDLPSTLQRDLFALDVRLYGARDLGGEAKSGALAADSPGRAQALASAGRLKLQSVMLGEQSRAVINGLLVAPGQEVEGWTLLQVSERHVLLKSHGITIRLRM